MGRGFYTNFKGKCIYIVVHASNKYPPTASGKLFFYYRVEIYGTTISKIAPTLNFLSSRDKFLNSSVDRYYKLYNTLYIYIYEKLFNALNTGLVPRDHESIFIVECG